MRMPSQTTDFTSNGVSWNSDRGLVEVDSDIGKAHLQTHNLT